MSFSEYQELIDNLRLILVAMLKAPPQDEPLIVVIEGNTRGYFNAK